MNCTTATTVISTETCQGDLTVCVTLEPPAVTHGSGSPSLGGPIVSSSNYYPGPSLVPLTSTLDPTQSKRIDHTIQSVIENGKKQDQWNQEHPGLNVGAPRSAHNNFTDLPENILENPTPPASPNNANASYSGEDNCYVKVEPIDNSKEGTEDAIQLNATSQSSQIPANVPQVIAVQSNGAVHYIKIEFDHSTNNGVQALHNNIDNHSSDDCCTEVSGNVNPGPSHVVSQAPADSTVNCLPNNTPRRGKPRNAYENGCAVDLPPLDEDIYIDTAELCRRISYELKQHSIPQAVFAERVLCRSQGTLSDLLRNPKPWNKLKSGRETFRRMYSWLKQPLSMRLAFLDLVPSGSVGEGELDVSNNEGSPGVEPPEALAPQNESDIMAEEASAEVSSTWHHPTKRILDPPIKKARLVFTDIQKRTLQAIFKETQRPSKEMQQTIAEHLGLDLSTVQNFFMNARRRSRLGPQADEPSPSQQIRPVTPPPSSPPPGKIGRPLKRMRSAEPKSSLVHAVNSVHSVHSTVNVGMNGGHTMASTSTPMNEPMVSYPPMAPHQPLLTLPSLGPLPPPRDVPTPPALGAVTFTNAMNLNLMVMSSPGGTPSGLTPMMQESDSFALSVANSLAPLQPVKLTDSRPPTNGDTSPS